MAPWLRVLPILLQFFGFVGYTGLSGSYWCLYNSGVLGRPLSLYMAVLGCTLDRTLWYPFPDAAPLPGLEDISGASLETEVEGLLPTDTTLPIHGEWHFAGIRGVPFGGQSCALDHSLNLCLGGYRALNHNTGNRAQKPFNPPGLNHSGLGRVPRSSRFLLCCIPVS